MKTLRQFVEEANKLIVNGRPLTYQNVINLAVGNWLIQKREETNKSIDYKKKTIAELKLMKIQALDELIEQLSLESENTKEA